MYSGGKISNIFFLNVIFMNNLILFIFNKMYNKLFLIEYCDLCISEYNGYLGVYSCRGFEKNWMDYWRVMMLYIEESGL